MCEETGQNYQSLTELLTIRVIVSRTKKFTTKYISYCNSKTSFIWIDWWERLSRLSDNLH